MPPVKSLGNSRAQYNYKFGLTGLEAADPYVPPEPVYSDDVFSTDIIPGSGSGAQTAINGIDLLGKGGMVWGKDRVNGVITTFYHNHFIWDSERPGKYLSPNLNLQEDHTGSAADVSFLSNGYNAGFLAQTNCDYVGWTFRKQPGFFDISTWSGDSSSGRQIPHSLGSTPGMIIIKNLTNTNGADWAVWHRSGGQYEGKLNSTGEFQWEYVTSASSTDFTLTYGGNETNLTGNNYIAYIFAHDDQRFGTNKDESIIKCGSYTGSTSGNFQVNLGFEPQWVMIKRSSGTATSWTNWVIFDNMRGVFTGGDESPLAANLSAAENSTNLYGSDNLIEFNPTGIKIDPTGGQFTSVNTNSETFVYMAIRRPHKPITDPTKLFKTLLVAASESGTKKTTGFPVDLSLQRVYRTGTGYNATYDRLRGSKELRTNENADENAASFEWDFNDGYVQNFSNLDGVSWNFRRAPGFLDVVVYKGTGSSQAIPHNLEAVPELMIVKGITPSNTHDWRVYHKFLGSDAYLELNTDAGDVQDSGATFGTLPTSSNFYVNTNVKSNTLNENYVAYLFASSPGVSKVGSYQGNNGTSTIDIDCGFADTASFVLIKDLDNVGSWYVWDKTRGIVEGVDPIIKLDSDASEMTTSDWIEPLSSGFQIGTSGTTINTSGKTYMFLAIA